MIRNDSTILPFYWLVSDSNPNPKSGDLNELYALIEKLQDKIDNECDNTRVNVEIEVLQQKTTDLLTRLNDIEMNKPDKTILSSSFTPTAENGTNGLNNAQLVEVMETLRKNKLEIGMAHQACEGTG